MGIEDEIRELLQKGNTPQSVIDLRYKKSTVYKIYNTLKTFTGTVNRPDWTIENIIFNKSDMRYLPGESVAVNFYFKNNSQHDLYVVNIGIQAEWMIRDNTWYSQKLNEVIRPQQKKYLALTFSIPSTEPLGEYQLSFGVECQYLPVRDVRDQALSTRWSDPIILHLKHPLAGEKLFLSHSVKDKQLVYQLEQQLDNYGINTIIGEDDSHPGKELAKKFAEQIDSCTIFLALLTDTAIRSEWVKIEVDYAIKISKPSILMREKSVKTEIKYEWISFTIDDAPEAISQTIMTSIKKLKETKGSILNSNTVKIIGLVLIGVLIGAVLVRAMRK